MADDPSPKVQELTLGFGSILAAASENQGRSTPEAPCECQPDADPLALSRVCRAAALGTPSEALPAAAGLGSQLDAGRIGTILAGLRAQLLQEGFGSDELALARFDTQRGPIGQAVCEKVRAAPLSIQDRSVGSLLGVLIGDALGAPYEGGGYLRVARSRDHMPEHFEVCRHMGAEALGLRYGMYTDDGNATLAVAESLAECGALVPQDVAERCARFQRTTSPPRECPQSAKATAEAVLAGTSIAATGRLQFPDGSFANGGAMKIAPVGLAYHRASAADLREAARLAVLSTHVHPEAVDGAAVMARCVALCLRASPADLDAGTLLQEARAVCTSTAMRHRLEVVGRHLQGSLSEEFGDGDFVALHELHADGFQIKAIEAVPAVLWCFCRWFRTPERCLVRAILIGGDTDTTCSMVGALCGALHGTCWIPRRWYENLENGARGRDYAVGLATRLAELNLTQIPGEPAGGMRAVLSTFCKLLA